MTHIPGYTANSEVNKLQAKFDRMQQRVDNCNALLIARAIENIEVGNMSRGLEILKQMRANLSDTFEDFVEVH